MLRRQECRHTNRCSKAPCLSATVLGAVRVGSRVFDILVATCFPFPIQESLKTALAGADLRNSGAQSAQLFVAEQIRPQTFSPESSPRAHHVFRQPPQQLSARRRIYF